MAVNLPKIITADDVYSIRIVPQCINRNEHSQDGRSHAWSAALPTVLFQLIHRDCCVSMRV